MKRRDIIFLLRQGAVSDAYVLALFDALSEAEELILSTIPHEKRVMFDRTIRRLEDFDE